MSGGSPPPAPKAWTIPNQTGAAQDAFNEIGNLSSMPNYAQQASQAFAPTMAGATAPTNYNPQQTVDVGNQISSLPQQYLPYATQLLDMGFDPQNEVYGRTAHNLSQQVRSGLEQRGINSSPYGAGVENQAMGDFNIDWENNKLNRASTAVNSALPVFGQAGTQMGQGQQVAQTVPQLSADIAGAGANIGNMAYQQPNAVIANWLNYVGQGNNANQIGVQTYQAQLDAWKAKQAQDAQMWQALGALGGTAISAAGNPASLFGSQLWG